MNSQDKYLNLETFVTVEVPAFMGTFQQAELEGAKNDAKEFPLERTVDDWWEEFRAYCDHSEITDELQLQ